jgi:hypothetical protein
MIQPGAVTGQKITGIAGAGMTQDNAGLLDVNVDNVTLGITSIPNGNYLHILPFSIGSGLIIPGSISNADLQNSTIGITSNGSLNVVGSPISLGGSGSVTLNLNNANSWTALQSFTGIANSGNISTTTLSSTGNVTDGGNLAVTGNTTLAGTLGVTGATTTNGITNTGAIGTGTLTSTGNVTDGGNLSVAGTSNLTGNTTVGGTLTVTGATTLNNTLTVTGATTTNGIANTGNIGTGTLASTGNITDGGNLSVAGTTTLTGLETANGGIQDNGTLNSTGNSNIGSNANTNNFFGTGAADNNTIGSTAGGTNTINGTNTFNGNSTFNGTAAFGANNVSGSNFTITGGSINNTPIGATTPSTGAFTTLSSSSTSNIGTGSNLNNTFGSGATSVNTFGNGTGSTNTIGSGASTTNFLGNGASTVNTIGFGDNYIGGPNTYATNYLFGITNVGVAGHDGTKLEVDGVPTLVGAVPAGGYELLVNGDAEISGTLTVNAFSATTMEADNGYFHNLGGFVPGTPINLVDDIYGSYQTPGTPGNPGTGLASHMNNVIIGNTTPAAAWFTTLNSSGNTNLATGAGTTNTFGSGTGAANTFGEATGTNAINGSTTVVGTTVINNTGAANTTIGETGADASTTTINVGNTGSLTLNNLASGVGNTSFLTLNGANSGAVQTESISSFIVGTNGVLVTYPGGVATAQFANTNALVPFTSDRFINTASNILHITDHTPADYATFNGATDAITLNTGTAGNTSIGNTGTVTIQGPTAVNNTGSATTQIGNVAGYGNVTVGNTGAGTGSITLNAGATGTIAANGTTNITGATTVVGTTLVNNSGAASTTIGNVASTASSTTVNVGSTGTGLTLNGITPSTTTTLFLSQNVGSGEVFTNALNNFIQGNNGVLVTYAGGVATAQFASAPTGVNSVTFNSTRYIITDGNILDITGSNGGAGTIYASFSGTNDAIGLNNTSTGSTSIGNSTGSVTVIGNPVNINNASGLTTNIATNTGAITNIGVSAGSNNINGLTGINQNDGQTTNIATSTAATTNIGIDGGTNTILGNTTINQTGNGTTAIGDPTVTAWWITAAGVANFTTSAASPQIYFNTADPYTPGGSMTMDGSTTTGGTSVVTVNAIPATSYGEQINDAGAAGGIEVTGAPTTAGIELTNMGTATGVNYDGSTGTGIGLNYSGGATGTGVNVSFSGTGLGVSAAVNGAGAYTGVAGSVAIVGLQNDANFSSAAVMGLNGVTAPTIDDIAAGVYGETNMDEGEAVGGVNSGAVSYGIGVYGNVTNATNFAAGIYGTEGTTATVNNYGVLGTTNTSFVLPTTIVNASNMGFSDVVGTYAVGADNEATGGTALVAQANGGGNVTAISATATTNAGNNATAGSFTALGAGNNEIGVMSNASTGTLTNIGYDATATGNGSVGVRVNAGALTGVQVDASVNTGNGVLVNNVLSSSNGVAVNFSGAVASAIGVNVDMANGTGAGNAGLRVQNVNSSTSEGALIEMTAGTGVDVRMGGAGTGEILEGVGAATGESVTGITGGTGIDVSPSTSGIGIIAEGTGSTATVALEVGNAATGVGGNVVAGTNANTGQVGSPQDGWTDTYVLDAADQGALVNEITIYNSLVRSNSSVIITVEASTAGPNGLVSVGNDAQDGTGFNTGHFDVYTTAMQFGSGVFKIHYQVVNH